MAIIRSKFNAKNIKSVAVRINKLMGENKLPTAFILINSKIGSENEVLRSIKKINSVKEAYVVYGAYDVVAKVEAETMKKLKDVITWNIRRLEKIRSTLTMIVI